MILESTDIAFRCETEMKGYMSFELLLTIAY